MNIRDTIITAIGGLLLLFIAIFAARVAGYYPTARAELGEVKMTQLEPATRDLLARLQHDALITLYISGREHMPSHMRQVESRIVDLLRSMKQASNGRLDYQIIDPEDDPEFVELAAHQQVAPFRVRSVSRDAYSEKTVWSTLHISYGAHPRAVINGITPEYLPHLQSLIVGQFRQMEQPRQPVFAIDSPPHFRQFEAYLRRFGEVRRISIAGGDTIPDDIDVLFWLDPGDVRPDMIRRLARFLESGRSAVVTGSKHEVEVTRDGRVQQFALRPTDYDAETMQSAFGLRPLDDVLVLDEFSQQVPGEVAPRQVRFFLRCIPPNQDFRQMRSMVNGHLLFAAPTPFALDGEALAQAGYSPTVLATSSDRTMVRDMTYGEADLNLAKWFDGEPAPKLPLMVWLRPHEPWRGSVIFGSSSSMFRDGSFAEEYFAHRRFVEVLTETLASNERLVIHRAAIDRTQPLPELTSASRFFWRAVCVALVPLLLAAFALWRGAFQVDRGLAKRSRSDAGTRTPTAFTFGIPTRAVLGLIVVLLIASIGMAIGWRADLTEGGVNRLAPATAQLAANARSEQRIDATLYFSSPDHLPADMRPAVRQLQHTLRELRRSGADIGVTMIHPEQLGAADRDALHETGIRPMRLTTRVEEVTTVRTVYATLKLESNGRTEFLRFNDRAAFDHLEFRLAFALWRLQTGRQPHIAFVADVPRLTASEVYHDFQERNLQAPSGTDVYSDARKFLEQHDFRVSHISPSAGSRELPEDADLVIWLQPRRDMLPMLDRVVHWLYEGKPAVIAAQHFYMQARQYRGAGFKTVYWPQPQVTDLHMHYLPDLGIELVHEVLFDEMKGSLDLITHVNVDRNQREYDEQDSALPFLIRAVAANFNRAHPIMRGVGDQLLPFASFIRLDKEKLADHGLSATTLFATSDRSWSYHWTGGWLPDDLLVGLPDDVEDRETVTAPLGRVPLAVLFEGRFPLPEEPLTDRDVTDRHAVEMDDDAPAARDGRLLLLGNSYLFRNERMADAEFRSDRFLLNIAAHMALDADLASVAGHRRVARGFDYIPFEDRLRWRAIVVAAGPALMLLFALSWLAIRRRPPDITNHK